MKRSISPLLGVGVLMFVIYTITQRFITPIPDWLAMPLLLVGIALVIVGGLRTKENE